MIMSSDEIVGGSSSSIQAETETVATQPPVSGMSHLSIPNDTEENDEDEDNSDEEPYSDATSCDEDDEEILENPSNDIQVRPPLVSQAFIRF